MKKLILIQISLLLISLSIEAQQLMTGLKLATPQQLAGIPLVSTPYSGLDIPDFIDLSDKMPPVGKQKHNDCVAWSIAYAVKSYQEKLEENNQFIVGGALNTNAVFCPSYIYNQINNGIDGGSYFLDALNIVSQQGVAKLSDMQYCENDIKTLPTQQQRNAAKNYKIDFWRQVNIKDIKEVKAQLNAGYPVMIGATIDEDFRDNGRNAIFPYIWTNQTGKNSVGHAMVVVGYNNSYHAFKVINSWGNDWGNDGYCWISYNLFPVVVNEGYVSKDAQNSLSILKPTVNNPTSYTNAVFSLNNVFHNIPNTAWGYGMNFMGTVQIPQGFGKTYQIVIQFYFNNGMNGKGLPVRSYSSQFSLANGNSATGTPILIIPLSGGILNWDAGMPYMSLILNIGISNLVAEPILYIDNFPVQIGQLVPFSITK